MKKTLFILFTALALGGCSRDSTAPVDDSLLFDDAADLAFSSSFVVDHRGRFLELLNRLPDNLELTAAQAAQIRALVQDFRAATAADREALAAILREARAARQAGRTREEIKAILDQALPIRERLAAAENELKADILAVLTPAQRAWLEAHRPGRCDAFPLTDQQKAEISALIAAFEQANSADLAIVRAALEQARAAHRRGASRAEIRAILTTAQPAMERLRAARAELVAAIAAVLTAEQRASGCHRFPH